MKSSCITPAILGAHMWANSTNPAAFSIHEVGNKPKTATPRVPDVGKLAA